MVKADCGRLAAENNALHEQLLAEGERRAALQKEAYSATKRLEGQLAELAYWKGQAGARYESLERDNAALRRKVAELLKLGEKRSKAGGSGRRCGARCRAGQGGPVLQRAPPLPVLTRALALLHALPT